MDGRTEMEDRQGQAPKILRLVGVSLRDASSTVEDQFEKRLLDEAEDGGETETEDAYDRKPVRFTDVDAWPASTNLRCAACGFEFETTPRFVPGGVKEVRGRVEFTVDQITCSFACAARFIEERPQRTKEAPWRAREILCAAYHEFTGRHISHITPAPSRLELQEYGGRLSRWEFLEQLRAAEPAPARCEPPAKPPTKFPDVVQARTRGWDMGRERLPRSPSPSRRPADAVVDLAASDAGGQDCQAAATVKSNRGADSGDEKKCQSARATAENSNCGTTDENYEFVGAAESEQSGDNKKSQTLVAKNNYTNNTNHTNHTNNTNHTNHTNNKKSQSARVATKNGRNSEPYSEQAATDKPKKKIPLSESIGLTPADAEAILAYVASV
jgi:hypothetical protein